ncbi:uncharacterized protein [Henckelia pumila]|uniref:uncharacterized protein n=1 Tax=Henckelia pumila TaxID=405737 RepID=UPI003C6DD5E9
METLKFLVEVCARKWWRSTSAPIITAREVVTWANFLTAFHKLYFPLALRQAKASELLGLKQGSMSIDEYQHKFFERFPYCPQISDSTEPKYNLLLYGLNLEIHDRVYVGDDMNYEGLFSRCRQEEDNIRHNRSFLLSRPASSLGPPAQFFKNSASSFSSGSGGVMRFGRKGQQRPRGQSEGGSNLRPRTFGQVFSLRHDQAVEENERVIAGMFRLCGISAFVLIDTGASHSFISAQFVKHHKLPYSNLDVLLSVSTSTGQSALAKRLLVGCPLEFEGNVLMANLMLLSMEDFDCILGIDVLTMY